MSFLTKLELMCVEPLKYIRRIECLEVRAFLYHEGRVSKELSRDLSSVLTISCLVISVAPRA